MDFEKIICNFCDEHPVWTWILARLVISFCACIIAAVGFFGLIVICIPFVRISEGASWEAYAVWLWLPVIVTTIWLMCFIIGYVWVEVIEG